MVRTVPPEIESKLVDAVDVFALHGFEGARIEDLAAATGVPKAVLYYYFDGKEGLFAHLLASLLGIMAEAVVHAGAGDEVASERLMRVIEAQLRVMADHPATCLVLLGELNRAGRIPEIAAGIRAAFHDTVVRLLGLGVEDGSLRVADTEVAGAAIFGAVTFTALHHLVDGHTIPVEAALTQIGAMVLDGLGA